MSVEKAELARRAFYDPLTQIANRSLFIDTMTTSLAQLPSTRRPIGEEGLGFGAWRTVDVEADGAAGCHEAFSEIVKTVDVSDERGGVGCTVAGGRNQLHLNLRAR